MIVVNYQKRGKCREHQEPIKQKEQRSFNGGGGVSEEWWWLERGRERLGKKSLIGGNWVIRLG